MNVHLKIIIGRRWNTKGGKEEVFVKCENQPEIDATWVEIEVSK